MITFNNNASKYSKFEFKFINLYPDIYIIDSIQKTALLVDFSLPIMNTVFELDNFGLIRILVVLVEDESRPRACAYINRPCKSFFHANRIQIQIKRRLISILINLSCKLV